MTTPNALLILATRLFREQQYDKARRTSQKLIDIDSGSPAAWAILGMSALRLGLNQEALAHLKRALALDSKSLRVQEALAEALYLNHRIPEALEHITKVIMQHPNTQRYAIQARLRRATDWPYGALQSDINAAIHAPDDLELRFRVAHTALNEGDPERALSIMNDTPGTMPVHYSLLLAEIHTQLGNTQPAQELCTQICASQESHELKHEAALLLFKTGPFQDAAAAFELLASQPKASVLSQTWHIRCQLFSGNPEAKNTLAALRDKVPDHPDVWCVAGIAETLNGDLDAANTYFEKAIAHAPEHGEAHLWLGELRRIRGDIKACLSAIDTGIYHTPVYSLAGEINRILAIQGQPSVAAPWRKIPHRLFARHIESAQSLVSTETKNKLMKSRTPKWVQRAGNELLDSLHGNRTGWPTQKNLQGIGARRIHIPIDVRQESRRHQLLLRTRTPEEVIQAFATLIEQTPEPTVYCHRGEVLLWLGRYADAEADFEAALALDITTRWAWIGLGASQILTQRDHLGLQTFERSKKHAQPGRTMWVYQAEAYRNLGDIQGAQKHIDEALRINPERTAAHILAGLIDCEQNRIDAAQRQWMFLQHQIPTLCHQVQAAQVPPKDIHTLIVMFTEMLTKMHGNRASALITWMHHDALHLKINDPNDVTAQYGL